MSAVEQKETAAQRVERIKREKPSWSIMDDIRRYAPLGFSAIPPDDLNVRFRAWGLYTQGDGNGTRGEEQPYFMMRLRTPNGLLTSQMVHAIAEPVMPMRIENRRPRRSASAVGMRASSAITSFHSKGPPSEG